jgi:cytochrome c553
MGKRIVIAAWLLLVVATLWPERGTSRSAPSRREQSELSRREFIEEYCATCHNDQVKAGGMSLSRLNLGQVGQRAGLADAELAERVVRKVRSGMMPPAGMPRPDKGTAVAFVSDLERSVDEAAAARPHPGRPALHRLNRTEYANSVRDLLGVNVDVSTLLPPDAMSHGFDNMSDVLTVSPALLEAYVRAAGKISRQAVGDREAPPFTSTYSVPRVVSQARHVEGAPFGTRGGVAVVHDFLADGEYVFKLSFYHHPVGPLFGINQGKGQQIEVSVDLERVALLDIDPAVTPDGIKTPPIKIKAGPRQVSAAFVNKFDGPVDDEFRLVEQTLVDLTIGAVPGTTTLPHLRELAITGPTAVSGVSDTPSRRRIFTCRPSSAAAEVPCARKIINELGNRAFRRRLTPADTEELLGLYRAGRREGDFEKGIRTAVQAIISHPEFVFRFEHTPRGLPPGESYRLTDTELASRLSYFLWSSAPDERLLGLASRGRLREPAVLEGEVRRMLADPRARALAANFAAQWLLLQNIRDANPDLLLYPDYDKTLAYSMRRETELLFESVMREDRSVPDLLSADYTFVDERLARHYSIPNVLGNRFRRVPVTDENRKGLLGHAGILMLTSMANRTSPVKRGKYVMEVLLGTPPPPPPPNVPALPENSEARTGHVAMPLTVRERMEQHRKNPSCAACHRLIDPLGLALENFDAVGVWRTKDSGFPIDPTTKMYDGTLLDGPASLRAALLERRDMFVGTFTERLLSYGLGRVMDYKDMPVVRSIKREAATNDYRFSSFVLGVVRSTPFQMRSVEGGGREMAGGVAPAARRR